MLNQLLIGSLIISLTLVIEIAFIYAVMVVIENSRLLNAIKPSFFRKVIELIGVTLWLLAAFSLATWTWAIAFYLLECFSTLEESLYFAMVSFTALGFGDTLLPQEWRLFSGMIAANGLLLFGLNTAVLIETLKRIYPAEKQTY